MSPSRRNALIITLLFWLAIAWLVASLRSEFDLLLNTLRVFLPGAFLLALLFSIEMMPPERDVVVMRGDLFGSVEEIRRRSYLKLPLIFTVLARIPAYPLKSEFEIATVDTQTSKLLRIDHMRVRCNYRIKDYKVCMNRVFDMAERLQSLRETEQLRPSDPELWRSILGGALNGMVDDKLRERVWAWPKVSPALQAQIAAPATPPPDENDPYALSLNRIKLADAVRQDINRDMASRWGLEIERLVFENVQIDPELIAKRTRDKGKEIEEAKHKARLEAIEIAMKGQAEAAVRAETVRRLLGQIVAQQGLPPISEKTVAEIVRAAMYSDGEMIWKGVLEKSVPAPPGTTPGTAKTA